MCERPTYMAVLISFDAFLLLYFVLFCFIFSSLFLCCFDLFGFVHVSNLFGLVLMSNLMSSFSSAGPRGNERDGNGTIWILKELKQWIRSSGRQSTSFDADTVHRFIAPWLFYQQTVHFSGCSDTVRHLLSKIPLYKYNGTIWPYLNFYSRLLRLPSIFCAQQNKLSIN